jgi:hypothetical protein
MITAVNIATCATEVIVGLTPAQWNHFVIDAYTCRGSEINGCMPFCFSVLHRYAITSISLSDN